MATIRAAGPGDIATIARLFREYAASLSVDLGYQGFDAELATLPGAYAPPEGALLLALSDIDEPLGCVALRPLSREPATCEIKRLHTTPAARRQGIGKALVEAAIAAARNAGYQAMRLDTLPDLAAAHSLYRALGFEVTAPYAMSPIPGTIFMRKTLTP
jgi:ribosomal protein S18 acetylase RimI-like enzyme